MHRLKVETGIVVFLLFFGTALLDALRRHTWMLAALYILLAIVFLVADRGRASKATDDARA